MVRIFVRHRVADYGPWRKVYDEFDVERGPMGVTGHAVYRSVEDGNDITVTHDFETEDAAREFLASEKLREAMQEAGVEGQPDAWLAELA